MKSQAFGETLSEQLELITNLSWYEPISDKVLYDIVLSTLDTHPTMQDERKDRIAKTVIKHTNKVTELKLCV